MSDKTLSVLVIAHPDDESMFFVPTIVGMKNEGAPLWLLCLTTGNFDGLGKIRSKELVLTGTNVLGFEKIILCDDDSVKDHPTNGWDIRHTASLIERNLLAAFKEISDNYAGIELITFDQRGVSGHVNHRDTYFACRSLWQGSCETRATPKNIPVLPPVSMWTLSTNTVPVVKYLPIYAWFLLCFTWCGLVQQSQGERGSNELRRYRLQNPSLNWRAMASHASQFVWYRRLFVAFSCYTYLNELKRQRLDFYPDL
jgi:N-acetylglucosaminylphosphatidylinositol deacetylase